MHPPLPAAAPLGATLLLVTSGQFRRSAVELAVKGHALSQRIAPTPAKPAAFLSEPDHALLLEGRRALAKHANQLCHGLVHVGALGLPELNALGLADQYFGPRIQFLNAQTHLMLLEVLLRYKRAIDLTEHSAALVWLLGKGLSPKLLRNSTAESLEANGEPTHATLLKTIRRASSVIDMILMHIMPTAEEALEKMTPHQIASTLRCLRVQHTRREWMAGEAQPPDLHTLQFIGSASDALSHPLACGALSMQDTFDVITSMVFIRLTPDRLFDSLAIHTMDTLLPAMEDRFRHTPPPRWPQQGDGDNLEGDADTTPLQKGTTLEDDDIGFEVPEDFCSVGLEGGPDAREGGEDDRARCPARSVAVVESRAEVRMLCQAVTAFSKVAELGRVPVRDVLHRIAVYMSRGGAQSRWSAVANRKELVQLSYLAAGLSLKWGGGAASPAAAPTGGRGGDPRAAPHHSLHSTEAAGVSQEKEANTPTTRLTEAECAEVRSVLSDIGVAALEKDRRAAQRERPSGSRRPNTLPDTRLLMNLCEGGSLTTLADYLEGIPLLGGATRPPPHPRTGVETVGHVSPPPPHLHPASTPAAPGGEGGGEGELADAAGMVIRIAFSFVRLFHGRGYKDQLVSHEAQGEGTEGGDGEATPRVSGGDMPEGLAQRAAARERLLEVFQRAVPLCTVAMRRGGRDAVSMRAASHALYAFGRLGLMTEDLLRASAVRIVEALQRDAAEAEGEAGGGGQLPQSNHPPHQLSNALYSLASFAPGGVGQMELHSYFDVVAELAVRGFFDLAPEKPNHVVYIIWAMAKVQYFSTALPKAPQSSPSGGGVDAKTDKLPPRDALLRLLLQALTRDAVERLSHSMVAMCVQALAKFPPTREVTAQAIHVITVTAEQMETAGCTEPLSIDLIGLGVSSGRWDREQFVNPMFALSKAFVNSRSAERGIRILTGKSLSRMLWSHSVVAVRHTTLCDMIVTALEDPNFPQAKRMDPLSLTTSLVAMSRLSVKNFRAVGSLCAAIVKKAHLMAPLALADAVQAVAEMGIPSRHLQIVLCQRAAACRDDFTPSQAASFLWNLSRSGLLPSIVPLDKAESIALSYAALIPVAAGRLDAVPVQYRCRLLQAVGLVHEDCASEGLPPAVRELRNLWPQYAAPLLAAIMPQVEELWWKDVANLLWGVAILRCMPPPQDLIVLAEIRRRRTFLAEDQKRLKVWDAFVSPGSED